MDDIQVIQKESYPDTLKNMTSRPRKLYYRGAFPAPEGHKYLCVVGSRMWTAYGRDSITKIISGLRGYPISIVSGLAIGIDSIAHMAALEAGLHCVAFPGSSLEWDKIYPQTHLDLARKIVSSGGALVSRWRSDYPMGKWAFPARNTLMAGLSQATLIVEAGQRSGSLMTAKHAEEYHRDVFAIPGPISSSHSYGPHMLIRSGAALISSSDDLLQEMGFIVQKRDVKEQVKSIGLDKLSVEVIEIISREEVSMEALTDKTGATASELSERISILELEGLIRSDCGTLKLI